MDSLDYKTMLLQLRCFIKVYVIYLLKISSYKLFFIIIHLHLFYFINLYIYIWSRLFNKKKPTSLHQFFFSNFLHFIIRLYNLNFQIISKLNKITNFLMRKSSYLSFNSFPEIHDGYLQCFIDHNLYSI